MTFLYGTTKSANASFALKEKTPPLLTGFFAVANGEEHSPDCEKISRIFIHSER